MNNGLIFKNRELKLLTRFIQVIRDMYNMSTETEWIESKAKEISKELSEMTLAEMDVYWEEAKSI